VPVAKAVLEILERRRAENPMLLPNDGGWVFPTTDAEGKVTHVQEPKEQRVGEDG